MMRMYLRQIYIKWKTISFNTRRILTINQFRKKTRDRSFVLKILNDANFLIKSVVYYIKNILICINNDLFAYETAY